VTEQFGVEPFVLPRKAAQLLISFAPPADLAQVLGGSSSVPTLASDAPVVLDYFWRESGTNLLGSLANERSLAEVETCCSFDLEELSASFACSDLSTVQRAWGSALEGNNIEGRSDFKRIADGEGLRASLRKEVSRVPWAAARRAAQKGQLGRFRLHYAVQNDLFQWYCLAPGAASLLPKSLRDEYGPSVVNAFETKRIAAEASDTEVQRKLVFALGRLDLTKTLTAELVVQEVLARDRDAWALGRVCLDDGTTIEAGRPRGWLRIDRRALADWYRAISRSHREPERVALRRSLQAVACVQQCGLPDSGPPTSTVRLLEYVVDGYELANQSGAGRNLAVRLAEAGVLRDDAFYVLIAGNLGDSYLPHFVDRHGVIHWGDAIKKVLRGDPSLNKHEKATLRASVEGSTYVYFEPGLWQKALRIGLNARQQRLLLSLLVERPGGRKGAQKPSSLNGFHDTGYQVAVRMAAGGYGSSPSRFGQFVSDLEVLSRRLGLVVHTRRGTVINEDGLAVLQNARRRGKLPGKTLMVMCYLGSSEDQEVSNCPPSARLPKSYASSFWELRTSAGLTQEEVAVILGVRRTTIANWENGTRAIPTNKFRQFKDYCAQMSQMKCRPTVSRHDVPR